MNQSSFYSSNDLRLHFGLGGEKTADLEIHWPSGLRQELSAVASNQLVTVKEGVGIVANFGWAKQKSILNFSPRYDWARPPRIAYLLAMIWRMKATSSLL